MRILIVHNRYRQRGGEDIVVESEMELLRSRGHDVMLFEKSNENVQGWRGAVDAVWSRKIRVEITKQILDFRPHIAHVHNVFHAISPAVYGAIAAQDIPIVQTLHNFRLFCIRGTFEREADTCERCMGHSLWRGAILKCYRDSIAASSLLATSLQLHRMLGTFEISVNQFVVLNEFCRRKFIECGIPQEKITVKPNFIDITDDDRDRPRSGGIFVGRLVPEKGIGVLAAALERVPKPFTVVGDGPEADTLRPIKGMELMGAVTRDEVFRRMRQAEYLVIPSVWYETFGLVMIEAFACRLPVIASNIGAMAELVEDGKTGLLFEAGSASDLAMKLEWAHAHPDKMREMGDAARAKYDLLFTSDKNYELLIALYEKTIGAFRSHRSRMT